MTDLTFYEFFCGGGGARAGLGDGWQCLLANDNDPAKMRSYTDNWGKVGAITRDVAALTPADFPGGASLAWASFPCQDLSEAGAGAGLNGYRSNALWPCLERFDALRVEGRPLPMIVLENVVGLMSPRSAGFLDAICNKLTGMGYQFGALEIDAALFVPQSRERVFVIAVDAALPVPAGVTAAAPAMPFHTSPLVAAMRRQKAAPIWWRLPVPPVRNTAFADLIEDSPTGVPWHTKAETERLVAMMAPAHLAKLDAAKSASKRMVGPYYKRMRPKEGGVDESGKRVQRVEIRFDDVAGCLRMASSGGSSIQTVMVVDGDRVRSRRLSAREAARLMGLPDSYKLPGNYLQAYDLMGDGLAVPVVRHLAAHIFEPILEAASARLGVAAE